MLKVAIIMGSTSDDDVMSGAEQILSDFGIEFEKRVISAHSTRNSCLSTQRGSKAADSESSSPSGWRRPSGRCRRRAYHIAGHSSAYADQSGSWRT